MLHCAQLSENKNSVLQSDGSGSVNTSVYTSSYICLLYQKWIFLTVDLLWSFLYGKDYLLKESPVLVLKLSLRFPDIFSSEEFTVWNMEATMTVCVQSMKDVEFWTYINSLAAKISKQQCCISLGSVLRTPHWDALGPRYDRCVLTCQGSTSRRTHQGYIQTHWILCTWKAALLSFLLR